MIHDIFKWVITSSCMGTALTFLIVLLRPLTKKVFFNTWHYYIWLIVLAVMIIPIKFDIAVNGMDKMPEQVRMVAVAGQKVIEPVTQTMVWQIGLEEIWLTGVVIVLLVKIFSYIFFRYQLQKNGHKISCEMTENFTDRKITVIQSKITASPFITGLLKPILVLPATPLKKRQFEFVLAHEMVHLKRKDILYKWIVCFAKCVHWFNPIIYFAAKQIDIECEISCDAEATEFMNHKEKKDYADTVLTLAFAHGKKFPLATGMADSKRILKKRILSISKESKQGKFIKVFSVIVLIGCMVGALFISGTAAGVMMEKIQPKLKIVEKLPMIEKIFDRPILEKITKNQAEPLPVENEQAAMENQPRLFLIENEEPALVEDIEKAHTENNYPEEEVLTESFIMPENARVINYSSDDKSTHYITLHPDENGLISVYFDSGVQNALAMVNIYDSERPGQGWKYSLPTDGQAAYEFDGFDTEKTYTVEINTYCPGNYGIEGNAYIY